MLSPKIPSAFICSMSFSGYWLACSSSRTTGRTSRSTKSLTVWTMAASSSTSVVTWFPPWRPGVGMPRDASHDTFRAQAVDVVHRVSELAQDGRRVLTERRYRAHVGLHAALDDRGQQRADGAARGV